MVIPSPLRVPLDPVTADARGLSAAHHANGSRSRRHAICVGLAQVIVGLSKGGERDSGEAWRLALVSLDEEPVEPGRPQRL